MADPIMQFLQAHTLVWGGLQLALLLLAAWGVHAVVRFVLVRWLQRFVRSSGVQWDDALADAKVFSRLAHVAPALVVYYAAGLLPALHPVLAVLLERVAISSVIVVATISASSFLNALNAIYSSNPEYRQRPIKGYLQVVKIGLYLLSALAVVSTLLDESPWLFVSGIGAMTAVLLLIFRDTILSLVASVQITSNDMVHVGDWIEMPQAGADGDVIDVALHTVKVQNWDKTITTIPTHKLIDESFKNWRGMALSGGRRIKRALYLDMNSVRFLSDEEIERFGQWTLLRDYVRTKCEEIEHYNTQPGRNAAINADIRRLTNLGTLRAYVAAYLHAHPQIHASGYTLIVRQLAPGPNGLPLEIYCFSSDVDWSRYEAIQADLFDHLLAILPEFGLRVYQAPSGADFERVRAALGSPA